MAASKNPGALVRLAGRGGFLLGLLFLAIEFFDELDYGVRGAALPWLRDDLGLGYAQLGLLLGLPHILGSLVEWVLMLLGDTPLRKRLIVGGGFAITLALGLIATAGAFPPLLVAWLISFPASGAFVSLSQATLMDLNPGREAQMMARWTFLGSLGNLVGPLLLAGGFALGWGWRWAFWMLAGLALILALAAWRSRIPLPAHPAVEAARSDPGVRRVGAELLRGLGQALRSPRLLLMILLLQLADLMMDVLSSYLPLFYADVMRLQPAQVALLLSITTLAGLASDALVIPLLEKFDGSRVVRLSALVVGVLYIAFLLAPWAAAQIALVLLLKLLTLGWYSVLQGEAYAAAPGRSGTVMALNSLGGLIGGIFPWVIGVAAEQIGLRPAMWLLLLGPLSILLLLRPTRQ